MVIPGKCLRFQHPSQLLQHCSCRSAVRRGVPIHQHFIRNHVIVRLASDYAEPIRAVDTHRYAEQQPSRAGRDGSSEMHMVTTMGRVPCTSVKCPNAARRLDPAPIATSSCVSPFHAPSNYIGSLTDYCLLLRKIGSLQASLFHSLRT